MESKRYTSEEVLNLQSAAYQKGYNEGYELRKQEQPVPRWPLFVIDKATGERHQVNKVVYHPENEPEPHVWCDTWYGHHVIGNDCDWADEQSNGAVWVKCSDRLPEISKTPKLLTVKRYESISEIYSTMAVTAAQLADIVKYDLANFEWLDESTPAGREEDAVAFAEWLDKERNERTDNYKNTSIWGKETAYKIMYDIFKQQKG